MATRVGRTLSMTAMRFAWASRTRGSMPSARPAESARCQTDISTPATTRLRTAFREGRARFMAMLPHEQSFAQLGVREVDMIPKIEEASGRDDDTELLDALDVQGQLPPPVLAADRTAEEVFAVPFDLDHRMAVAADHVVHTQNGLEFFVLAVQPINQL